MEEIKKRVMPIVEKRLQEAKRIKQLLNDGLINCKDNPLENLIVKDLLKIFNEFFQSFLFS